MKIARAVIENFRHIERLELDFTDSIDRVRPVALLVGPNTSGKTTILDALGASIKPSTGLTYDRPGFALSPRAVVRRGASYAKVICWIRFSAEEIATVRELFNLAGESYGIPDTDEVRVTWTYPDPYNQSQIGLTEYEPQLSWPLFRGREKVARLLSSGQVSWDWFGRVGGIITFDQQRMGWDQTGLREVWQILQVSMPQPVAEVMEQVVSDPRALLWVMGMLSYVPLAPGVDEDWINPFKVIQERYAQVCAPRELKGVVRDEIGTDLLFSDGSYEYGYNGLSSGEQMFLLFFIRMVFGNYNNSIILVDEIELHQHPIWQRRLLHLLPEIGKNNQIIATTHSQYVRDVMPQEAVFNLGNLVESPQPVSG
jgi:energy-coupling factor transporter ATP-binding protein EcfA2